MGFANRCNQIMNEAAWCKLDAPSSTASCHPPAAPCRWLLPPPPLLPLAPFRSHSPHPRHFHPHPHPHPHPPSRPLHRCSSGWPLPPLPLLPLPPPSHAASARRSCKHHQHTCVRICHEIELSASLTHTRLLSPGSPYCSPQSDLLGSRTPRRPPTRPPPAHLPTHPPAHPPTCT